MEKRTHFSAFGANVFDEPSRKKTRKVKQPFTIKATNNIRVYIIRHRRDGNVEKKSRAILHLTNSVNANGSGAFTTCSYTWDAVCKMIGDVDHENEIVKADLNYRKKDNSFGLTDAIQNDHDWMSWCAFLCQKKLCPENENDCCAISFYIYPKAREADPAEEAEQLVAGASRHHQSSPVGSQSQESQHPDESVLSTIEGKSLTPGVFA